LLFLRASRHIRPRMRAVVFPRSQRQVDGRDETRDQATQPRFVLHAPLPLAPLAPQKHVPRLSFHLYFEVQTNRQPPTRPVTMIRRTLLLAAATQALVAPVTRRTTTKLHAIDAVVLEQCAGYAAIPTCFVGTGAFLLGREPEGTKLEGALLGNNGEVLTNDPVEEGEVDIYRDTALRYAGYANEVGEAFAPLTPGWCVPFSYAVAITYVIADTIDKTKKVLDGTKYSGESINTCAAIEGVDALIWQLAASVALPGYTIHQLVAIVVALLDASGVDQSGVISALPTACGLAMIPFIVKPLDELAEVAMDVTFRKVSAPYLESCEV